VVSDVAGAGKSGVNDPRFTAAVAMIGRTGASSFRIGWSHEDDGEPTAWYALAAYPNDRAEAAGAMDPVTAVLRLCELLIDGGVCQHCGRRTIFVADADTRGVERLGCVYAWDPELATYRRGCEGDTR